MNEVLPTLGQLAEVISNQGKAVTHFVEGEIRQKANLGYALNKHGWSFTIDKAFQIQFSDDRDTHFLVIKPKEQGIHLWLGNERTEKQFDILNPANKTKIVECGLGNPGISRETQDKLVHDFALLAQILIKFLADH